MPDQAKITKSERALLRRLVTEAWNAELHDALTDLFEDFGFWADDGMSSFELSDKIHEFHNGIARELYGQYTNLDPSITVSRAVAFGFIDEAALGEALLRKLAPSIESFREVQNE